MLEIFKKKKLIVVHYVNVMGVASQNVKGKLEDYENSYFKFGNDKNVKELCIPTNGEARVEFVKV